MPTTNPEHPRINVDEDVDDLDDVLDQFSTNPPPAPPPTSTLGLPTGGRPRQNTRVGAPPPSLPGSSGSKLDLTAEANEDDLGEEFARELAKGMENLMKGLEGDPPAGEVVTAADEEKLKALRATWEAMLLDGVGSDAGSGGRTGSDHEKTSADFKARLKSAMNNLKESESKLQGASGAGAARTPESLATLLDSLSEGDAEKEIESFLEDVMRQLLSKDVLQEPLKELSNGFPGYLTNPPKPLSEDDKQRYVKQQACVSKILKVFAKADYRDDHPEYSKEVMELLSEMQSYGSPPPEIMEDLPPGLDALDKMDDKDCIIS